MMPSPTSTSPAAPRPDPRETAARLEQALSGSVQLPLLPTTAQRAMQLVRERDGSLADFARLIESDAALAATILKLANSPLYCWGRTITGLGQAVVRLGMQECQSLLLAVGVKSLAGSVPMALRPRCRMLWQHSFLTDCLCRLLSRELGLRHNGEEFTAGLLHDLGRIVIAMLVPDAFVAADPVTFEEDEGTLDRERDLLGYDHCTVGAHFAEQSRMPRPVISAIRHHHLPGGGAVCRELVELVAAADELANKFHRGQPIADSEAALSPRLADLTRGLDPERAERFRAGLPDLLKGASQALAESGLR